MLTRFKHTYNSLNSDNIELLKSLYSDDVVFEDPFHHISGLANLQEYFARLYQNVEHIEFEFKGEFNNQENHAIYWNMYLQHPKLNKGKAFSFCGNTLLKQNTEGKFYYHKDYFDGGAMLYEKVAILGRLICWIKGNL